MVESSFGPDCEGRNCSPKKELEEEGGTWRRGAQTRQFSGTMPEKRTAVCRTRAARPKQPLLPRLRFGRGRWASMANIADFSIPGDQVSAFPPLQSPPRSSDGKGEPDSRGKADQDKHDAGNFPPRVVGTIVESTLGFHPGGWFLQFGARRGFSAPLIRLLPSGSHPTTLYFSTHNV